MDKDTEIVEIDEGTEHHVRFLMLIMKKLAPRIDKGETYCILMSVILGMMNDEEYTDEDAEKIGESILDTADVGKGKVFN